MGNPLSPRSRRPRQSTFRSCLDSKLRGCDLVEIKIREVVGGSDIRNRATVIQQKTNRPVQFELTADVRATLIAWLERRGGSTTDYLFPGRVDLAGHMSTRPYARLVDEWVIAIGPPATFVRYIFCWATRRSRTRFAILASLSKTRYCCQSIPKSDSSSGRPMALVDRFRASAWRGRTAVMGWAAD